MTTKIICFDAIRFGEDEIDDAAIDRYVPTFQAYRDRWVEYGRSKNAGIRPKGVVVRAQKSVYSLV